MWISFALTIDSSMRWLNGKPALAGLFGFIGGPLAYWIAIEIWHAASFTAPSWIALLAVGIAWAIATPLLFVLLDRLSVREASDPQLESTQAGTAT